MEEKKNLFGSGSSEKDIIFWFGLLGCEGFTRKTIGGHNRYINAQIGH